MSRSALEKAVLANEGNFCEVFFLGSQYHTVFAAECFLSDAVL